MLRHYALEHDLARRLDELQALMKEKGLGATLFVARGAPEMMGVGRYFTNLNLWSVAYVVVGADRPKPVITNQSPYEGCYFDQEATTSIAEYPDWAQTGAGDAFGRALEIAREFAGSEKRIGTAQLKTVWLVGDLERFRAEMQDFELVDITKEVNAMRSVKSPFEIEAIYDTGRMLSEAFDRFGEVARPGVLAWKAAAAAEEVLKAQGCYWGRSKYSLNHRAYTFPTPVDRRFTEDDIILFELVYAGPLGYWVEMTALYSFCELPPAIRDQVEAHEKVIEAAALAARSGARIGRVAEVTTQTWKDLGYSVLRKHTPDCHSIGLDEVDGPSGYFTPDELLQTNMVLSFHPSTVLEGDRAFLISDNHLVTPMGAVRMSPKSWNYRRILG